jgi:tetratricopeptide (TPR) repeat protein
VNQKNTQNELELFYEKYSKDFADLALFYNIDNFTNLSLKDKIFVLAHRLKKEKRFNFAIFLFEKLFSTFTSMSALINEIECLIAMEKFEKALHLNDIAFELFLETEDLENTENIEKTLAYQRAKINFLSFNFPQTFSICENYIVNAKQKRFFTLYCATLIALKNFEAAKKLIKRFRNQVYNFLSEVVVHLSSINQSSDFTQTFIAFINSVDWLKINNEQSLTAKINSLAGNLEELKTVDDFLKQEIVFFNNTNKSVLSAETLKCKE